MPPTRLLLPLLAALAAGCAAVPAPPVATRALAALGLVDAPTPPRRIELHLHAAPTLNAARDGVAVPTRVQLHWLRDPRAFLSAPYQGFADDAGDAFEYLLLPGRRLRVAETAPPDARAFGLVVLFRAPAPGRWRHAFGLAQPGPVRVSVHECAVAVAEGQALDAGPEARRIGDTACPGTP